MSDEMSAKHKYYEFFAGGGMARLGLGADWTCLFANDFSAKKAESYRTNFPPASEFKGDNVFKIQVSDLPPGADMAWASFPCQDLSLAGNGQGLNGLRSGSFWGFWRLVRGLADEGRPVPLVVIENVVGTISANKGQDFLVLLKTLVDTGYCVGPMVIDAQYFVPQSRPRLFIVAVHDRVDLPVALVQRHPDPRWHPPGIARAQLSMPKEIKDSWIWWNMPYPAPRSTNLLDVLEDEPTGVRWHTTQETNRLLDLMSPTNLDKVKKAQQSGRRVVGTIYRRIRTSDGEKRQRAEIRMDDLSGCLRTGSGGSSKQFLMIIEGQSISSRLLSSREAARLMGVHDGYILPENYSDAYHLMGDGLAVPVVSWISDTILLPALNPQWTVESAYPPKIDKLQFRMLESVDKRHAEHAVTFETESTLPMIELQEQVKIAADSRFDKWCTENQDTSYNLPIKGRLLGALIILDHLESGRWTYSELSTVTSTDPSKYFGNRSISGHTSSRIAQILNAHGHKGMIPGTSIGEMGRTSTGTKYAGLQFMQLVWHALEGLPDEVAVNTQGKALTPYLLDRVFSLLEMYQQLGGIDVPFVASESIATYISKLMDSLRSNSGALLQHLVGAKLEVRYEGQQIRIVHNSSATADVQTGRLGDFEIGSAVFHVTKSPTPDHYRKAWSNVQSGRKVYLLVPNRVLMGTIQFAETNQTGFTKRVNVYSIEQYVAQNLDELAIYDNTEALRQLRRLLVKYNELVTRYENDPSLKIVIPDFGVA